MSGPIRKINRLARGAVIKIEHCDNGGWIVDRQRPDMDYVIAGKTAAFSSATDLLSWLKLVFEDNPPKKDDC